jgi:hypothetical protein
MVSAIGQVVGRRAVVEVGVRDHADLLESLEVAVDRGQWQGRTTVSSDGRGQTIGCCVPKHPDRIDDSLPLPGQTHALGPQHLAKVSHTFEPTR